MHYACTCAQAFELNVTGTHPVAILAMRPVMIVAMRCVMVSMHASNMQVLRP